MAESVEPKIGLSASRIGVVEKCSWLYWAKYCMKLPDKGNDGSSKGWIAHLILECLADKKKRGGDFKKLQETQDVESLPHAMRLIRYHAKKLNVADYENIEDIKRCIIAGINFDFYGEELGEGFTSYAEIAFDYVVDEGGKRYRAKGFIDRLFISPDGKFALIRDFKTSKEVYKGSEITNNHQHYLYSLAVRRMFPQVEKSVTQFLFLKHDMSTPQSKGVINIHLEDNDILEGYEYELTEWQLIVEHYNPRIAVTSFASDKPYPTDNTFGGPLVCGRARFKGQKKKDGNIMWHCPAKFEVAYFQIIDRKTQIVVDSCLLCDKDDYMERFSHDDYEFRYIVYGGCYKHCSYNY